MEEKLVTMNGEARPDTEPKPEEVVVPERGPVPHRHAGLVAIPGGQVFGAVFWAVFWAVIRQGSAPSGSRRSAGP